MNKTRSPTYELHKKALEYSKVIFDRFCWFFLGQIAVTYILILIGFALEAQTLIEKTLPIYQTIIIAYFGKSGVENMSKIVSDAKKKNNDKNQNG